MDAQSKLRKIALIALVTLSTTQIANAQALQNSGANADAQWGTFVQPGTNVALPPSSQTEQSQTTAMMPNDKQPTAGNVVELQQMLHGSDLNELRTTYNGTYGASLLFHSKNMTYYIALFQQKNFWRVIKSQDAMRAETIYKDFVRQTVQLSDVEIRRTQLAAQKAFTERLTAFSHDQANRLQADLDVARQQQTIVASQQQQSRAEAMALAQQKAAAQDRLRSAQRQVSELQRQMESSLPSH